MEIKGSRFNYDVIIAGAGPAGTSAAIHLAVGGAKVLLVEQKSFPRAKLCGEFISPECIGHFTRLGVVNQIIRSGPMPLRETVFYARNGSSVVVPIKWFDRSYSALGLSRARMDQTLIERAKSLGVVVLENTRVVDLLNSGEVVRGVRVKRGAITEEFAGVVTLDATGAVGALSRKVGPNGSLAGKARPRKVAFKAHIEDANPAEGVCEIYSYKGGYGGLSDIEEGMSNFCFIVAAKDVRLCNSDPERLMREVVMTNERASQTLSQARIISNWLSVTLRGYGRRELVPKTGLLTIGDAAAFIDPFTGSGILMALESGELAAFTILEHLTLCREQHLTVSNLGRDYSKRYQQKFDSRFRVSGLLRRAAFLPELADIAIRLLSSSKEARLKVARATRRSQECNLKFQ